MVSFDLGIFCHDANFVEVVLGMLITNWLTLRSVEEEASSRRSSCPTPYSSTLDTPGPSSLPPRSLTTQAERNCGDPVPNIDEKPNPLAKVIYQLQEDSVHQNLR